MSSSVRWFSDMDSKAAKPSASSGVPSSSFFNNVAERWDGSNPMVYVLVFPRPRPPSDLSWKAPWLTSKKTLCGTCFFEATLSNATSFATKSALLMFDARSGFFREGVCVFFCAAGERSLGSEV